MNRNQIKEDLLSLSAYERSDLLRELEKETSSHSSLLVTRKEQLNNKIGSCPYCSGKKYRKHGKDKSSQHYYCNSCKLTFTEYTGTWLAAFIKKSL